MILELRSDIARWGLIRGIYGAAMRAAKRWFGLFLTGIYRAPLKKTGSVPPEGVTPYLATDRDLEPFFEDPEYQLSAKFVKSAFARQDLCVATCYQDTLAAYGWVAYHKAPHIDGIWVRFGPDQRYNYKNLTLPQFRGRHIRGSYGVLQERDKQEAVTHSIAFIETHNFASVRAEHRNGGQRVGLAGYVNLFGRTLFFRSPGAARYGFAFYKSPRKHFSVQSYLLMFFVSLILISLTTSKSSMTEKDAIVTLAFSFQQTSKSKTDITRARSDVPGDFRNGD